MRKIIATALACLCVYSASACATDDPKLNRETCQTMLEFIHIGMSEALTRTDNNVFNTAFFKTLRSAQPVDSPVRFAFEVAQKQMQRGATLQEAMNSVAKMCRDANPW